MPSEPEPRGELALVHDAVADEVGLLDMLHQQRAEIARIGQRAPHHLRVATACSAVREGDRAGLLQQAELGHLPAGQALGDGGRRLDV